MNAVVFQMSATSTIKKESVLLDSGLSPNTPSHCMNSVPNPMVGLKSRKKIIPWMTMGMAHGMMIDTRTQRRP